MIAGEPTILAFDTATPATTVALARGHVLLAEARHDPGPGERPGHATHLLVLVEHVLTAAGADWDDLDRIAVGVGPGTFTGLRIGIATARALAQSTGIALVAVSTLDALVEGVRHAGAAGQAPVLAVIDARRGEAFATARSLDGSRPIPAAAYAPAALVERGAVLAPAPLAVGDGSLAFRDDLEGAGAIVSGESGLHRVRAWHHARLAKELPAVDRTAIRPDYLRQPDAKPPARQGLT